MLSVTKSYNLEVVQFILRYKQVYHVIITSAYGLRIFGNFKENSIFLAIAFTLFGQKNYKKFVNKTHMNYSLSKFLLSSSKVGPIRSCTHTQMFDPIIDALLIARFLDLGKLVLVFELGINLYIKGSREFKVQLVLLFDCLH